jgi:hypothetical protein
MNMPTIYSMGFYYYFTTMIFFDFVRITKSTCDSACSFQCDSLLLLFIYVSIIILTSVIHIISFYVIFF